MEREGERVSWIHLLGEDKKIGLEGSGGYHMGPMTVQKGALRSR